MAQTIFIFILMYVLSGTTQLTRVKYADKILPRQEREREERERGERKGDCELS